MLGGEQITIAVGLFSLVGEGKDPSVLGAKSLPQGGSRQKPHLQTSLRGIGALMISF